MKSLVIQILAACSLTGSAGMALAAGGPMGGATEFTQLLNNAELAASVGKQAQMVNEQILSKITQIDQLTTMQRNLQSLSSGDISQALGVYRQQKQAYTTLLRTVSQLRDSASNTRSVFDRRNQDFLASGQTDLRNYIRYEAELAKRKGGVYKQRLDQDLGALDDLQARSVEFQRVADQTGAITGNLQGLQQLSQLSAMQAGELMELKAAVISQNADRNQQAQETQANAEAKTNLYDATVQSTRDRKNRPGTPPIDTSKNWNQILNTGN